MSSNLVLIYHSFLVWSKLSNNTRVYFVVPPSIIDKDTSTDMVVREATNVTLTCKAKGYPAPYVMWRRADGKSINYDGKIGESSITIN